MRPAIEVVHEIGGLHEILDSLSPGMEGTNPHDEAVALIEADRLAVVAEIVAELRSGDRGYWTWRDYAADHIKAKFGEGNNGDR